MPVIYDSKKIIPAPPQISISKEVRRSEDGTTRKVDYSINVKGTLVAYMGSPNSNGVFWDQSGYPPDENVVAESRLKAIIVKQGALNNLFCTENKLFEIQPYDGSPPIKAIVKLRGITFEEGKWFDTCNYTIQLEVVKIWFGNVEACGTSSSSTTPPEESWSIEQSDERGKTYRIQHTVTSSAKSDYDETGTLLKEGWKVARDIVLDNNLGLDATVYTTPSAATLTGMGGYNYVRGQQIDEANGKYTVTESWLMYDPSVTGGVPCLEEYNINIRVGEDGKTRASIDGNLTGLEVRNNTTQALVSTRWENVQTRWVALQPSLITIAQDNAGITLNSTPLSQSVGRNPINGTISFSREYDDRPVVVSGALSATVQVNDSNPSDIFASLVVLGKSNGPVLQSIGTVTASRRSLSVEVAMPAKTLAYTPTKPNVDAIIAPHYPAGAYKERDEENWSEETGRYSRQIAWTWVA